MVFHGLGDVEEGGEREGAGGGSAQEKVDGYQLAENHAVPFLLPLRLICQ